MARMPGAAWHPLGDNPTHQPLMSGYRGIIFHTAVGSLYSTDGYFMHGNGEGYIGTESHFIVGFNGEIWQITDTARTADANLEGNPWYLSVETADSGEGFPDWSGSDVPAWLPAQIQANARIAAWASATHGFPLTKMPNSLPSSLGIGDHRLGIDPYRVDGGLRYSESYGKACPGDERHAQVDDIVDLARSGAKSPYPQFRETSPAVRQMQVKLKANKYATGKDRLGYYGAGTKAAIVRLQRAQGWEGDDADGEIGPMTWALIEHMTVPDPPQDPPADPRVPYPLLEDWQQALGEAIRAGKAVTERFPKWRFAADELASEQAAWAVLRKPNHPEG